MTRYNQLRTLSFQLNPEVVSSLPYEFYTMPFPEDWKALLSSLQAEASQRQGKPLRVPIANLNAALRALVPDIISLAKDADKVGERPWLYSAVEVNPQVLLVIVQSWVRTNFPKATEQSRQAAIAQLKAEQLKWKPERLDLAQWTTGTNGTASPIREDTFKLLPDLIAARLSQPGTALDYKEHKLRFWRAPLAAGRSGAELVSWPPLIYNEKGQRWPYSIMVTLTVQTVPFQAYPVVHCEVGVRRWAGPAVTKMRKDKTSVYVRNQVPWIEGLHNSLSFGVAPIVRDYSEPQTDGKTPLRWRWANNLGPLLADLNLQGQFPEPNAVKQSPLAALNMTEDDSVGISAAIVYRNGMRPNHGVGPGLMPKDRRDFARQIAQLLQPELVFTPYLPRVDYRLLHKLSNPFFPKDKEELAKSEIYVARRKAIAKAVGGTFTLEVCYQSPELRKSAIETVCRELGLPLPKDDITDEPYNYQQDGLNLRMVTYPLGALGRALEPDSQVHNWQERLHAATRQRIDEVATKLEPAPSLGLHTALIELADADGFATHTDPKFALRMGYANVGRLTQFITPPDEESASLSHRTRQAFLDLLRQLGVQGAEPNIVPVEIASKAKNGSKPAVKDINSEVGPVNYVGVWMIKQNSATSQMRMQQRFPVLVHMASNTKQISAIVPGMKDWLPYPQALIAIARSQLQGGRRALTPAESVAFIQQTIRQYVLPLGDTVVLCHAQNLRGTWGQVANGQLNPNVVAFGTGNSQSTVKISELRLVRVRGGDSETPEWYAENDNDYGFSKGLFRLGAQVFASTHSKPKQLTNLSKEVSKAPSADPKGSSGASISAWNPGLYELTVICPAGDEAWKWAVQTHELRLSALHYEDATALPLPLHLAEGIEEYILPLNEDSALEQVEEEENPEDEL